MCEEEEEKKEKEEIEGRNVKGRIEEKERMGKICENLSIRAGHPLNK